MRAKDLYDLAHILRHVPLDNELFWRNVGSEFRVACKSRSVDCSGWASFEAAVDLTKDIYEREQGLPRDLSFEDVWESLKRIATRLEDLGIIPFAFDLPA